MRTETKTINIYKYEELPTDAAKEKARQWWETCVDAMEWSEQVYEDASQVGLKIDSFDIGRGSYCKLTGFDSDDAAQNIKDEHGNACDTHQYAEDYLFAKGTALDEAETDHNGNYVDEYSLDEKLDELAQGFEQEIQECYLRMLREQHEHYFSEEHVAENIIMNDYEFNEDGSRY